jgi:hypothetical protein
MSWSEFGSSTQVPPQVFGTERHGEMLPPALITTRDVQVVVQMPH